MAKKQQKAEGSIVKKIIDEIVEKAQDYENSMSTFMESVGSAGDLFKVKPPKRISNTFSNPRQTEFHRAVVAVATLCYRMMTAADPFFEARAVDLNADYDKLDTLKHTWLTQIKYANYKASLLKACHFAPTFGTVINQLDYRVVGVSHYGRRVPVTVMIPRPMDQVMFDRATLEIDQADWLSTADVTSSGDLMRMAAEAKEIGTPWNPQALESASKDKENANSINKFVLNRVRRSGFTFDDALSKKKEILMFYGKLECMNDGIEYVAALVNRKYLVRFHANTNQNGKRPFTVTKWVDFDHSLGYGLYALFGNQHRAMDANRQKAQDLFSMGAYNMWQRRKDSVANENAIIGPNRFIDVENIGDIAPLSPNLVAGEAILKLDEILKQEFRSATGASDTLQAMASDATTATSAALSQNEGMRLLSVRSESMSGPLVRDYLEANHFNNAANIREPFNINAAGVAKMVYPSDIRLDLDIEAKVTTDKDFSPKRLTELQGLLQTLISTKSSHPDQMQISVLPIVKAIASMLDVRPSEVVMPAPNMIPGAGAMGAADLGGLAAATMPGGAGAVGMVDTPVGNVLSA